MIKILIISQIIQPYFNPEFGGVLYYKGQKIIDSFPVKNDIYFEFVMKGAIDPYFLFYGTFPLSIEEIELEEAYATSLTLPFNLTLGKFKSRFTRLNPQHPHSFDFPGLPNIYNFLTAEENEHKEEENKHQEEKEGINLLGLGISYILPIKFFLEIGLETLEGTNKNFDNFISYLHLSFDLPFYTTLWIAPSIYLKRDSIKWYGSEIVLKRIKPGEERLKGLLITASYFRGEFKGGYADIVYKFTYGWRIGTRCDLIYKEKPEYTLMIDYSPTEFSRFRVSYKIMEKKLFFEFNFSVGPHGAHPF